MAAATKPKGKLPMGPGPQLIKPKRDILRPRLVSALWICSKVATEQKSDLKATGEK
jgi:hypothetical protein